MTVFRPFPALRYEPRGAAPQDLSGVIAPPYDVLSAADRAALEDRDPHNSVRIDYPHGADDPEAYHGARLLLNAWIADGTLVADTEPSFSVYRMTATDEAGITRRTTGVFGGLGLEPPGTGDVLPHEETTSKDKADRLNLIRATEVNTSPIWGLSLSAGLGACLNRIADAGVPLGRATDDEGVIHEVWRVTHPELIAEIAGLAEATPVVIADGHHRFETGLAYLAERGDRRGSASAILALLVELADDQLVVRAIHRLVNFAGALTPTELIRGLEPFFSVTETARFDKDIITTMAQTGSLTFFTKGHTWTGVPKPGAFPDSVGLDSTRVRIALAEIAPDADIRYQHSVASIARSVDAGDADLGILLRPATVSQIRTVAKERTRMPAKTTFFWPKPRTGVVFRSVR
jgi:uncharacterized protein (DUF1015 family)